jgi:hypothetical protein
MNPIVAAGLLIGGLCGAWMFIMGFSGWYRDPQMLNLFFLVIVIEIAGLLWGLRKTAARGRTYSGQVVAGTTMAIIAGLVIIVCSLLFTTVAFPDYFEEINAMSRELMQAEGKTEAEITQAISAVSPQQTPVSYALSGFLGTFMTGVIASAIIAAFIRQRPDVLTAGV